jgi:hypothetical protein
VLAASSTDSTSAMSAMDWLGEAQALPDWLGEA